MDTRARMDMQEKTLARQLEWIRQADSKVQIVLTLNLVLIGAVVAGMPEPNKIDWRALALLIIGCAMPAYGLYLATQATAPQITGANDPDQSLLFFGRILRLTREEHKHKVLEVTDDSYLTDLCDQVHVNALIANAKYGLLKDAVVWTVRGIAPWAVAVYLLYRVW